MRSAWLNLNIVFIMSYGMKILRLICMLFITVPVQRVVIWIPTMIDCVVLFIIYIISLIDNIAKENSKESSSKGSSSKGSSKGGFSISGIWRNQNFLCLCLFLTRPSALLLLPFWFISIYHASSYILSKGSSKGEFPLSSIPLLYRAAALVDTHLAGRIALQSELLCATLSLLLIPTPLSSTKTAVAYLFIVRQQHLQNAVMRSIIAEFHSSLKSAILLIDSSINNTRIYHWVFSKYNIIINSSIYNRISSTVGRVINRVVEKKEKRER